MGPSCNRLLYNYLFVGEQTGYECLVLLIFDVKHNILVLSFYVIKIIYCFIGIIDLFLTYFTQSFPYF